MRINETVQECYEINKEKGWEALDRRPLEVHALITSEVAEATEEVRNGKPDLYQNFLTYDREQVPITPEDERWDNSGNTKVEGEAVELADAVIRIMSYYGSRGWDFEKILRLKINYNRTRPHLHGGKKI